MRVFSYASLGYEGEIIAVEVDIRRGIPGIDIVGMPDVAVKEARERVRIAVRRSGFTFPKERVLVNLAPAGVRKEGASHDLSVAVGILESSQQIECGNTSSLMVLGELQLSGEVRPVNGILSAVAAGIQAGVDSFVVPEKNFSEALMLGEGSIQGISHLRELAEILQRFSTSRFSSFGQHRKKMTEASLLSEGDFSDIRGQPLLKRVLEVAVTGMHNLLLFGPPGSGKTMSVRRLSSICPPLKWQDALSITRIWSQAGRLTDPENCIGHPPLRTPHHSASLEGLVGGGPRLLPGEVSLAHKGILFLDEAPEFGSRILQGLREPMETQRVWLARAGHSYWYPADFQLILAANPCACGNLGKRDGLCLCSRNEVYRYWKRIGGALLDRIDLRLPVEPISSEKLINSSQEESSASVRERIAKAVALQESRYADNSFKRNARLAPGELEKFCPLGKEAHPLFSEATAQLGLSCRACHSVLKIARTIADLAESERISQDHLLEAIEHRRYGDRDIFWHTL